MKYCSFQRMWKLLLCLWYFSVVSQVQGQQLVKTTYLSNKHRCCNTHSYYLNCNRTVSSRCKNVRYTAAYTPDNGPDRSLSNVIIEVTYSSNEGQTLLWVVDSTKTLSGSNCQISVTGGVTRSFFLINGALNQLSVIATTGICPVEPVGILGQYTIRILSRVDGIAETLLDGLFEFTISESVSNVQVESQVAFPPAPVFSITSLTVVDYNPTLTVTSEDDTPITTIKLGGGVKLSFGMTINNFAENLDEAGARITDCEMSENIDFTPRNEILIDGNGCFTSFVLSRLTTDGFVGSATASNTPRVFTAKTPAFELNVFDSTTLGENKNLYFRCVATYSTNCSTSDPGTCGGPHCSAASGRRKRDTSNSRFVKTSITIIGDDTKVKCTKYCPMSDAYKATLGVLIGIAVILFFAMIFTYKSAMNAIMDRKQYIRNNTRSSTVPSSVGKSRTMSVLSMGTNPRKPMSQISSRDGSRSVSREANA